MIRPGDDTPIKELGLGGRALNRLIAAGLFTAGDVRAKQDIDLLRIRDLGRRSLYQIRDALGDLPDGSLVARQPIAATDASLAKALSTFAAALAQARQEGYDQGYAEGYREGHGDAHDE